MAYRVLKSVQNAFSGVGKNIASKIPVASGAVGNLEPGPTQPIPTYPYLAGTHREAVWPFLAEYKKIAGHSAEPALIGGLALYMTSQEMWSLDNGVIKCLEGALLYHIYRAAQAPLKNWLAKEQKADLQKYIDYDQAQLVDSESKIAENAAVLQFLEARPEFFDIMQNQVELQAEVTYRKRLLEVETEIKKRLDYQLEMQNVQRSIEEKHIAAWVEKEVLKSIAEQKDEDTFQACLNDLEEMAAAKASA